MKDFSLFIKHYYCTAGIVEKIQKAKILNLQGQKTKGQGFYQNVQRVIVKNRNLSKSKKLVDF